MVQEMMVMKQCSRSVSHVGASTPGDRGSLLAGETISTSDLNFVIDEVGSLSFFLAWRLTILSPTQNMVHIAESTVGRRYAGWFIKNTERAQRILEDLKNTPLPAAPQAKNTPSSSGVPTDAPSKVSRAPKVAWGGVKVA